MAVSTEDQLAGAYMILHHDLMADTLSLIEGNAVFFGKITHFFLGSSSLWAVRRNVVIHDPDQLAHIGNVWML